MIRGDQVEKDEVSERGGTHGKKTNAYRVLVKKPQQLISC
jgi:hypothetical protein